MNATEKSTVKPLQFFEGCESKKRDGREKMKRNLRKLLEIPLWYPRGESNAIVRTVIR